MSLSVFLSFFLCTPVFICSSVLMYFSLWFCFSLRWFVFFPESCAAPWSLCVLCAPALFSVDSDLSSALFFLLSFYLGLSFAFLLFFAFWTLDNSSSSKLAFSCPTCLAPCLPFLIKCDKTMVYTEMGKKKTVKDRKWRVKHYTQGYNLQHST